MAKFVVCLEPEFASAGIDLGEPGIYSGSIVDCDEVVLVNAEDESQALKKVADFLYDKYKDSNHIVDSTIDGDEFFGEMAFFGFCLAASSDSDSVMEIIEYFGEKDGISVFALYQKYKKDSFTYRKLSLYPHINRICLDTEDRDTFLNFDSENLKKLTKRGLAFFLTISRFTEEIE